MPTLLQSRSDLQALLTQGPPLLDVRAPVEFARGALPGAVNLPLLTDDERAQVGTCYKQVGAEAAIALGHRLVQGDVKAQRLAAWIDFARAHPQGVLYCFRGGLRSQTVQLWMAEAGVSITRIAGGYKALRSLLIETLESWVRDHPLIVLGGLTGTGKTEVIQQLPQGVDLERHAQHRGSSFGRRSLPQPSQIDFENALGVDVLRKLHRGLSTLVVEDESQHIGTCALPHTLTRAMAQAPMVWLEEEFDARIERILHDYVVTPREEFAALWGVQEGEARYADNLLSGLTRLRKRLGDERYTRLFSTMQKALTQQLRSGTTHQHRDWIAPLLREYYDPSYQYQRRQQAERIVFIGQRTEVLSWLKTIETH